MKNTLNSRFSVGLLLSAFAVGTTFVACGDSTTETIIQEKFSAIEEVKDLDDLPECDSLNEGIQIKVKADGSTRLCVDESWEIMLQSSETEISYSCSAKKLADESGLKITCNGDSIGVVLNGENGGKGDPGTKGDPGKPGDIGKDGSAEIDDSGCNIISKTGTSVKIKCGDEDAFTLDLKTEINTSSSSSSSSAEIIEEEEPIECVKDEEDDDDQGCYAVITDISGESQKGPFLRGASVIAYELLNGRTLKQTGKSFRGSIDANNGLFNIKSVKLSSQYAYIEASGSYKNEVTGKNSDGAIELRTLTNLKGRKTANINLLTHLEYNRVIYLVTREGYNVAEAKRKALREILLMFDVDTTSLSKNAFSEDLTVFGETEADAALLAISILLQGQNSAANLKALLATISYDIAETGRWTDKENQDNITKWAFERAIANDSLYMYKENVRKWKLSEKVPSFEKHIRKFVGIQAGLGICDNSTKSVPLDTIVHVSNEGINYYAAGYDGTSKGSKVRFICSDKDADGKKIEDGPKWRIATTVEKDSFGWGQKVADGKIRKGRVTDTLLVFSKELNQWRIATQLEFDTFNYKDSIPWADTTDGAIKKGEKSNEFYVFDNQSGWRNTTTAIDYTKGIGGCTKTRADANYKARSQAEDDQFVYSCILEENSYRWQKETDVLVNDTYGESCPAEIGKIIPGKIVTTNKYVCENESDFREPTAFELMLNKGCVKENDVATHSNTTVWNCIDHDWVWDKNSLKGTFTDSRDQKTYKMVTTGHQTWMAENLNYDAEGSECGPYNYSSDKDCNVYGRIYTWGMATDIPSICPDEWHLPQAKDFEDLFLIHGGKPKELINTGWTSFEETAIFWTSSVDEDENLIMPAEIAPPYSMEIVLSLANSFHYVRCIHD